MHRITLTKVVYVNPFEYLKKYIARHESWLDDLFPPKGRDKS